MLQKETFIFFSFFILVCRSAEERKMSARVREDRHTRTLVHVSVCHLLFLLSQLDQESWRKFASFLIFFSSKTKLNFGNDILSGLNNDHNDACARADYSTV